MCLTALTDEGRFEVDEQAWQAEQFERHRARLRAVAYRMLGSVSEADDAVQETWLRLSRASDGDIENMGGWLTTVVGRVCIDMLRARQARREDYVGTWLPEVVTAFLAAAREGDFDALVEVLDPDVVFRVDSGKRVVDTPAVLTGAVAVARQAADQGPRFAKLCRPALVNGAAGIVVQGARGRIGVVGVTVIGDRITEIDLVLDPEKVRGARLGD